jgi:4-amino-4-deoxy-L-arabinose transferase-like glycosyltransferase
MAVRSTGARERAISAAWLLALLPLFLLGQRHVLWGADEPREAEIAREIYASRDWVVPRLDGVPFLETPPLAYWGGALVFEALGGPSEWWCRLPSAFWALVGTASCAWLGSMLFGRRVGVLAAAVLATSQEWLLDAHTLLADTPLAAGVAATFALLWYGYRSPPGRRKSAGYLLAAAACGVAFLGKGPIGVALPATGALVFLAWRGEWREAVRMLAPANVAAFAVLTAPWLVLLRLEGGRSAIRTLFVENMLVRFFSASADHAAPLWDYAFSLLGVTLPWAVFLAPAIVALARPGALEDKRQRCGWQYLVSITAGPLLLLTLASAKRPVYLLPLMPGLAIATAAWLAGSLGRSGAPWARLWRAGGTLVFAGVALVAWGGSLAIAAETRAGLSAAVIGLAVTVAGVAGLVRSLAGGKAGRIPAYAAAFAFLTCLSLFSPAIFGALEGRRGYRSLTGALARFAVPGTTVYGYALGERELGVVCFQQRAAVPQIADPDRLRNVLARADALVVVPEEVAFDLHASGRWPALAEVVWRPAMRSRPVVVVRGAGR